MLRPYEEEGAEPAGGHLFFAVRVSREEEGEAIQTKACMFDEEQDLGRVIRWNVGGR